MLKSLAYSIIYKQVLHEKYVYVILHQARAILKTLPNVNRIDLSYLHHICIIGDLHGQLADLLHIFNAVDSEFYNDVSFSI